MVPLQRWMKFTILMLVLRVTIILIVLLMPPIGIAMQIMVVIKFIGNTSVELHIKYACLRAPAPRAEGSPRPRVPRAEGSPRPKGP